MVQNTVKFLRYWYEHTVALNQLSDRVRVASLQQLSNPSGGITWEKPSWDLSETQIRAR